EILTGSRETKCDNNDCTVRKRPTLAHEFAAGHELASVAVFASWGPLARVVDPDGRMLVSVGRESTNFPRLLDRTLFERGERADPAPGYGNYRPDRYTAELALRYLRTHRPRFMFLSLGDTDEHAHHDDYPHYLEALRFADWTVGEIARTLAELNARGEPTLLVVTSDHGRSVGFSEHGGEWPESAHSWLIAAGDAVTARGIIPGEETYALADIAPTIRAIAGLPASRVSPSGVVITELFQPQALAYAR
ncbi:MAG TPA: sulfatase-like hydrolase/transferase, partial [Polyangiaceae bacterium]|nr:sulfatase-like hydrolase/transferase [Polyangiaceae bacterium]